MTVCKYFQQGNCRFGASCRFEHPQRGGNQAQTQFGNRFAPLNSGQSSQARAPDGPQYPGLTEEIIQRDLTSELPLWILSCYGPGRDAPEQLFGGPQREQSFEEMRMHYMLGAMNGNPQGALNDIQTLYQNAHQQIQHTLSNIPAAIRYVIESQEKHPNRIDICNNPQAGSAGGGLTSNAFGAAPPQVTNPFGAAPVTPANPATSALAQASVLGQKPSSFATPAFGQPAQPANSAFGQTSALGASNNVFARPSQPGAGGFGQPSVLGGGSGLGGKVFGQGVQQPAFGQTGFPQTPATQPGPGFGQPASLGANPNPFGAPQQPAANPFGQPQQPVQNTNMLGTPGMNATLATNNPFGAPSPAKNIFGTQGAATTPGPFGQLQQQQQQAQQTINPFGNPLAATEPPVTNNPFGQPATSQVGSPFGGIPAVGAVVSQVAAQAAPAAAAAAVAAATQGQGPYGQNATRQHPDISTYSAKNPDGTLRMFKGKPVMYDTPKGQDKPVPCIRQFDGSMVRIWMPNGAPAYTKETEAEDPSKYDDPAVQQQWASFMQTGMFADGLMPEVPPKREWCQWDF